MMTVREVSRREARSTLHDEEIVDELDHASTVRLDSTYHLRTSKRPREATLKRCHSGHGHEGLAVVVPGRDEAVERIAAVLDRSGLLSDMFVPANLTGARCLASKVAGPDSGATLWFGKWTYRTRARTSAPLAEAVTVATLRLPGVSRETRQAVTRWRNRRVDERSAREVRRGRATGALTVEGWSSRSLAVCAERTLPGFLFAAMDIWGVNRSLVIEALATTHPLAYAEVMRERDLTFEENATLAVARASHVIVETEGMARRIRELAGGARPTVVLGYGVVSPPRLPPRDGLRRRLRVLSVARVGYAKGIHYYGDAVHSAAQHVEVALVAGGGVQDFPVLRRRCSGLEFLGNQRRSELERLYSEADVFVLATLADAMARTVLEAMASGLPVIVTRESGYDGIIEDGVQGFFVPARDSGAIAEKLTILANDGALRLRMGRAARELADRYSWEAFEENVRTRLVPLVAEALSGGEVGSASFPVSIDGGRDTSSATNGDAGRGHQ